MLSGCFGAQEAPEIINTRKHVNSVIRDFKSNTRTNAADDKQFTEPIKLLPDNVSRAQRFEIHKTLAGRKDVYPNTIHKVWGTYLQKHPLGIADPDLLQQNLQGEALVNKTRARRQADVTDFIADYAKIKKNPESLRIIAHKIKPTEDAPLRYGFTNEHVVALNVLARAIERGALGSRGS